MSRVRFRTPANSVRVGEWVECGIEVGERVYDPDSVDILPPTSPSKIVCAASNYEGGGAPQEVPDSPILFLKPPSAIAGHGSTLHLPVDEHTVFFEGELAVVIGEECRDVPESDVLEVVAGYTCANDITDRDYENMVRRKAFDNAAPLGPSLVTPDRVPTDAEIRVRVNGETRQHASLTDMIFSVTELVSSISSHLTLEAGDVILTGSPDGMGALRDGDDVAVEIEGLETLRHRVSSS